MREVSQRLLIFLSVCTIVFIFVLVNIFGFFGGRWYERSAQDEADQVMVFPKNEDGSLTIEHGDEEVTLFKTWVESVDIRDRRTRVREEPQDREVEPSEDRHDEPHCSGSYHLDGCEHSRSRQGRPQFFFLPLE